ncbi:efflux transporter outer membrane subunit [Paraburkholderia tropica]|uniref:Multidrug efflux system outer membrane protein n=1 Tax=Paraburkholderia tropica TaxID=92647 RepID=A0ABX5MRD7_9BURK|nr:efflux transporter outer membrane subunit [Paraburkholderia tropica]MBB3001663.1 multidrug efflux system outer membrane protein [Paraburkholderia tropica]MBB6321141.1 multidrug efflux system outer membrane protein [Paraburkholderia tropica]MDE1144868.1 efflux transporter outer membrane subunit [Paraburkholderia tropica]PXX15739.1 multidrug efflux system outer membrane protein [Paraburkholderia tropica]PZW81998.1 multidrug efflux system outer membrane protein [Paraburkholderia tropica]
MNKLSLTALGVAAAFLSAACTLEPHYTQPAAPVSAAYPTGPAYDSQPGADARSAQGHSAADIGWRDFFKDPRLQKLIELALQNNRDLRVSVLKVAQARAQYRIERANLMPTVSVTGTGTRTRTPADLSYVGRATVASDYDAAAGASWELDFFGKVRSLSNEALHTYLSTAQARKAAEITLVSEVADQYLTMLAYDDTMKVTKQTLDAAQKSYELTKTEFDTGTGSELDLREAAGVVQQAHANYESEVRLRAQAENALVLLVGAPLPADLPEGLPLDSQALLADIPAGLPSDLLTRRPDILEAEETLKAANANIGAARAAFFPSISLTGQFGYASASLGSLFKPGQLAWDFGPTITMPIFEGGANKASLDVAKLEKDEDVAAYEKAIQTAFREVADGLAARGTYDTQISDLRAYTESEQRRYTLSDLRYRNGVDSYLSVLSAQTDLYSAQQSLISANLSRLTNLVDLYQYLGGGWIAQTGDAPRNADSDRTAMETSNAASSASAASAATAVR